MPRSDVEAGPVAGTAVPERDPVIEAMRRHLVAARPATGPEALKLLRAAFPYAPLAARIAAAGAVRPRLG